jgi:hypothetical protein
MSLLAAQRAVKAAHKGGAGAEPRRIAKASLSNAFGDDRETSEECWDGHSAPPCQLQMYQSGTTRSAPLWNGPSLRPAFVAQVLGQVMMEGHIQTPDLIVLEYRRGVSRSPAATLLDRSA